jgi:hypothetical protein
MSRDSRRTQPRRIASRPALLRPLPKSCRDRPGVAHLGYLRGFTVAGGARVPAEAMLVQPEVLQARAGLGCGREDLSLGDGAAEEAGEGEAEA